MNLRRLQTVSRQIGAIFIVNHYEKLINMHNGRPNNPHNYPLTACIPLGFKLSV